LSLCTEISVPFKCVTRQHRHVQELKVTLSVHQNHLADLADDETKLNAGHYQTSQ
jgi:hypothetical protein